MNFRPLLFIAVGFASGIFAFEVYRSLALPNVAFFAALVLIVGVVFLIFYSFFKGKSKARTLFILAFLMGLLRMGFALPQSVTSGDYQLSGTVSSISESSAYTVILTDASINDVSLKYKVKLNIRDRESDPPSVGDRIETRCFVKKEFVGYDISSLSMLSTGVGLSTWCKEYEVTERNRLPLTQWIASVRSALKNRIGELFKDNAPMVTAFLLGDRSGIDYGELESFRNTGTAHLLSLSGFHVGVITAGLMFLLPKRYPKLRFFAISLFLLLFCMLTGFAPSLVRASIMCVCLLLADVTEQRRDSLSSISLAAIVILAFSPYSLWSAGFRLSFAATIGIILFADCGIAKTGSPVLNRVLENSIVTFSAAAATVLISARYFGYVDTYTLPANVIAVPFYSLAISMSFGALLLGIPLPFVAKYFAWVPDKLIGGVNFVLSGIASLPYARLEVRTPLDICGFLMLLLMFMISPYVLRPIKHRLIISIPVIIMFLASIVMSAI